MIIIDEDYVKENIFEICTKIRENEDNSITPIVVVSSIWDLNHSVDILGKSVQYYINKPVDDRYLYNVVKNMENIEITERHNHSAPVAYVPEGQDATVSLQSGLDFKFVNNNNYAIRFEATCSNGNVTVKAFKEE